MQNKAEEIVERFTRNVRAAHFKGVLLTVGIFLSVTTVCVLFCLNMLSSGGFIFAVISGLFVAFSARTMRTRYEGRQIAKLNEIIDKDCDPETFTDVFRLLKTTPFYRKRAANAAVNIAHGLCMLGNFQETRNMLREIDVSKSSPSLELQFYFVYANCSEALGDLDGLEWSLSQVTQMSDTLKLRAKSHEKPYIKSADKLIQIINAMLTERNGQYEQALEVNAALLNSAKFPIQKTAASYRLAKLYSHKGDYASAKSNCEFVIQHGNKLYFVAKAEELLEECEKHMKDVTIQPHPTKTT